MDAEKAHRLFNEMRRMRNVHGGDKEGNSEQRNLLEEAVSMGVPPENIKVTYPNSHPRSIRRAHVWRGCPND
ncbi:MAG TPA: hypothetical protein VJJ28_02645 [Candidatus Paceibacterota bacterium]